MSQGRQETVRFSVGDLLRSTRSRTVSGHRNACLIDSVKFILPNYGELIDESSPDNEWTQTKLDLLKLPFPCVAFEAPWEKEPIPGKTKEPDDLDRIKSSKRIALCLESTPEHDAIFSEIGVRHAKRHPSGGIYVISIFWLDATSKWTLSMGGLFLPYDSIISNATDNFESAISQKVYSSLRERGMVSASNKNSFKINFFPVFPELYMHEIKRDPHNKANFDLALFMDSRDEANMAIEACSVINCANVITEDILPPEALNKKRRLRDKQPFFSYKVLQIAQERHESNGGIGLDGTPRASVRTHLRRGHLRRLENKVIWVRSVLVNPGSQNGAIKKDYALLPTAR